MAYEVVINKRFINKLRKVLFYLDAEWGEGVADDFLEILYAKIDAIHSHPHIGSPTRIEKVRGTFITKHNRMFYRVDGDKIVVLDLQDNRMKKNKYG